MKYELNGTALTAIQAWR